MFVADINPTNDHSYSLVVQTEPEVEVETVVAGSEPRVELGELWGRCCDFVVFNAGKNR
jgi:hypothetical protein